VRNIKRALIIGVALGAPILVGAQPAAAASSASCTVTSGRGCVTAPVQAAGSVNLVLSAPAGTRCSYRLVPGSSVGTFTGTARVTVVGVVGSHRLELFNCSVGARGTISA
jgi:hypothetical protein